MTTLAKVFDHKETKEIPKSTVNWVMPDQHIGIEIEIEGVRNKSSEIQNHWLAKSDGSLRGGVEYVLARPLSGQNLTDAIEEFFTSEIALKRSMTSGAHIHLNMRDSASTLQVMQAMTCLISIIEPAVFEMFAEDREFNGYTNPLDTIDSGALGLILSEDIESDAGNLRSLMSGGRSYKYYGFNLMPLAKYGSVEFRYFPTPINKDELIEWIQFVMSVKRASLYLRDMTALKVVLDNSSGWDEFIGKFFPDWHSRIMENVEHRIARKRFFRMRTIVRAAKTANLKDFSENLVKSKKFKKYFSVRQKDPATGKMVVKYGMEAMNVSSPGAARQFGYYITDSYSTLPVGAFFADDHAIYLKRPGGALRVVFSTRPHVQPVEVRLSPSEVSDLSNAYLDWSRHIQRLHPTNAFRNVRNLVRGFISSYTG